MVFVLISLRNDESINYNLGNKKLEKQYRENTLKNKEKNIRTKIYIYIKTVFFLVFPILIKTYFI